MGPLRRLIGGLVVVSAAILVVLVAALPAASAPTLAALSIHGGSTQALASVLCGTSGGVSCPPPASCGPSTGVSCSAPVSCGPSTGVSCSAPVSCGPSTGVSCSAPVSCGPSTGVSCSAPVSCGPSTGVSCSAPVSCGPSTGVPCLPPYDWLPLPVTCGPSSGVSCPAPVSCGPSSGVSLTGPSCVIGKSIVFGQQPCGPSTDRPCGKLPQCVGRCRPLQISPSPARPGEPITVTGNDYARCNKRGSQVTLVWLFFGNQAVDVTGSGGSFSVQATVPADAAVGNYIVFVECYVQSHQLINGGPAPAASRNRVLRVVAESGPTSQARLSSRAGMNRSDVVVAVNDLVARGMIKRKPDPADRRRNIVTITPAGRAHLREATRVLGTRFLTVTKAPGHSASGHSPLIALVSSGGGGLALGGLALMVLLLLWALV